MARSRGKRTQVEPTPLDAVRSTVWGMIYAISAALLLMFAFAGIALLFADPGAVAGALGYVCLYLSAAIGGFIAFKYCRGFAILCGLYTGLGFATLTFVLSLLVSTDGEGINAGLAFVLRLPIVAAAIGGAMLATYKPQNRRRRHRR